MRVSRHRTAMVQDRRWRRGAALHRSHAAPLRCRFGGSGQRRAIEDYALSERSVAFGKSSLSK